MPSVETKKPSLDKNQELYKSTGRELNELRNEVMKDEKNDSKKDSKKSSEVYKDDLNNSKELDKALKERWLKGIEDVMWAESFKWQKILPWENLRETYKDFDFSKIAKNWKFLPGVEKEDAFWKYVEIEGRKFYDSMAVALSDSEEPMFTYHISNAGLQLGNQIWAFNLWKWMYYSFSDGNKADYSFKYSGQELKNSEKFPAIRRYLESIEKKKEN